MINEYKNFVNSSAHFENKRIQVGSEYKHQNILSLKSFKLANKEISSWDKYEPTPLYYLSDLAKYSGVSFICFIVSSTMTVYPCITSFGISV